MSDGDRAYTLEELRGFIDALSTPMSITRGDQVVAANEALARVVGRPVADILGRPWVDFIPAEEKARLQERYRLRESGKLNQEEGSYPIIVEAGFGRMAMLLQTTYLPAAAGGVYGIVVCQVMTEAQKQQEVTDLLAAAAAEMVACRTEKGARDAAVRHFARHGISASFLEPHDPRFDDDARRAHQSGRPVFAGAETLNPTRVYLPIDAPRGAEILIIDGQQLATTHSASLTLFSGLVSSALKNGALIADLESMGRESQRQLSDSRLMLELARTTSGTLELRQILDAAADFMVRLLDVSNCFIMLYDEERRALRGAASSSTHRDFFRTVFLPIEEPGVSTTAARERRRVVVEDVEQAAETFNRRMVDRLGEKALLALPMVRRDVLLGVVLVDDTRGPRYFTPQLLEVAEASVAQVALAVSNARLYESLRRSYAELEATRAEMVRRERLAALGELSAVVAHEVRNPLGVIFNAVSSLRRFMPEQGDVGLLVGIIAEESDRLNRIVGDLLDFARPRTLSLELEEVGKFISESIDAAKSDPTIDGRLRFEAQVQPGLPLVPMDRHLLRQALVNVLSNAAQSMPQGGKVTVRAALAEHPESRSVRIEVSDEGQGISQELAERIFEPFFTTRAQGTGLGLAVVKRIVEAHKGAIEVSSVPGKGTTFSFHLPLARQPAEQG